MTNTNYSLERRIIVPTLLSEEWRYTPWDEAHPPPMTNVNVQESTINEIRDPRDYPYAQMLSRTNLLPGDEAKVNLWCKNEPNAILYTRGKFVKDEISFRNNISVIMLQKMSLKYRNTCPNLYNPIARTI